MFSVLIADFMHVTGFRHELVYNSVDVPSSLIKAIIFILLNG